MVKLLVFQGSREGALDPVKAVTASYLSYTVSADIRAEADQAAQASRIKSVFNLKDVSVLTEAYLSWEPGRPDKAFHFFQLDKRFYLIMMTPVAPAQRRFRIEVFEQNGGDKVSLLDTEFSLSEKSFAVFGFDDKGGQPYFLSLQAVTWPVAEVRVEHIQEGDAVRAVGDLRAPRLIKEVSPVYPEAARQASVEGTVILEAQTDIYGRVQNVKVLRSIPLLDQPAVDAVRQWIYEAMVIDGRPRGMIFTVTVRFSLRDGGRSGAVGGVVGGVLGGVEGGAKAGAQVGLAAGKTPPLSKDEAERLEKLPPLRFTAEETPKLIKKVDPVYPAEARQAGLEGAVIIEAVTDVFGRVASAKILRSVPKLDAAALNAIRQWVFDPPLVDGKPRRAVFTATVRFSRDGKK